MSQELSGGNQSSDIVGFIQFVVPYMKSMNVEEFKIDSMYVKFKSEKDHLIDFVDPLPSEAGIVDEEHNKHLEVQ